jgi:hypothetical protein
MTCKAYGQANIPYMTGINGETNKGTYANPYKISTARDLDTLSYWVRSGGTNNFCYNTWFKMTNNIDLSLPTALDAAGTLCDRSARATNFIPIGGRNGEAVADLTNTTSAAAAKYAFAGNFDGNNFIISNMRITGNSTQSGLFNCNKMLNYSSSYNGGIAAFHDTIKNLNIHNCTVAGGSRSGIFMGINGGDNVTNSQAMVHAINVHVRNCTINLNGTYSGIFCGDNGPSSFQCSVTNSVLNNTSSGNYIGAFSGDGEDCYYEQCWVSGCTINAGPANRVGGFYGDSDNTITKTCYVTNTTITGSGTDYGGFIGYQYSGTSNSNVYTTATLTYTGAGTPSNWGGFDGGYGSAPSNSFYISTWNNQGIANNTHGTVKTEAEMKAAAFVTTLNNSSGGTNPWAEDYVAPWGNGVNYGFPRFGTSQPYYIHDWETVTLTADAEVTGRPGTVIIEDGGSLINNSPSATITGGVNFVRYLYNERYTLVGTACKQGSTTYITAGNFLGWDGGNNYLCVETNQKVDLLSFTYTTNMWSNGATYNFLAYNSNMIRGNGYLGYVYDTRYNSALGNPWQNVTNRGEVIPLTATNVNLAYSYDDFSISATNTGNTHTAESNTDGIWFPLANPYPGNLYAKNFITANTSKLSTQYVYTLNSDNTWNAIGTSNTDRIKHGEGFFVSGNARTLTWNYTKAMMTQPSKKNENIKAQFDIDVTSTITSTATFMINDNSSNGFDEMDAFKFIGMNEDAVEPYFFVDGNEIAINSISTLPYECPMNIYAYKDFYIEIAINNIPSGLEVFLIDGTDTIDMNDGHKHTFDVVAGTNENRFKVKISGEFNGLENAIANNLDVWVAKDRLNINGENLKEVMVYNTVGQVVYSNKLSGSSFSDVLNLPNGAYTVKVFAKNNTKTIKFIIAK